MRFRIRRFMKRAGGAAPYRTATPASDGRTRTSGKQRSCATRPHSTTVHAGCTRNAMPAPPSVRAASNCAPAHKIASIAATGRQRNLRRSHPSRSSSVRLVCVSLKYAAQPRRRGVEGLDRSAKLRPRAPRNSAFTFAVSRSRLDAAMRSFGSRPRNGRTHSRVVPVPDRDRSTGCWTAAGDSGPPCGVPSVRGCTSPSAIMPAARYRRIRISHLSISVAHGTCADLPRVMRIHLHA